MTGCLLGSLFFQRFENIQIFQVPLSVHMPTVEGGRYFHGRFQAMIEELIPWVIYIGLPKLNNTHVPCYLHPLPQLSGSFSIDDGDGSEKSLLK